MDAPPVGGVGKKSWSAEGEREHDLRFDPWLEPHVAALSEATRGGQIAIESLYKHLLIEAT